MSTTATTIALGGFSVGVELGQILALSVILAAMALWRRTPTFRQGAVAANVLIMTAGFVLMGQQLAGFFWEGRA